MVFFGAYPNIAGKTIKRQLEFFRGRVTYAQFTFSPDYSDYDGSIRRSKKWVKEK
jgi:hypothetical protein